MWFTISSRVSVFFSSSSLSLSHLTEVLHSNYWRACCSNNSEHSGTSNRKEVVVVFSVLKKTIFLGKVLLLCIVNAWHKL